MSSTDLDTTFSAAVVRPDAVLVAGDKPIRHGVYQAVSLRPAFTIRQLAALDAFGQEAFALTPPRGAARRLRAAERRALRQMERTRTMEERRRRRIIQAQRKEEDLLSDELPRDRSMRVRRGWGTGFAASCRFAHPMHATGMIQAGVLDPLLTAGRPSLAGPVIGIDAVTGIPFCYDAWSGYRSGLVTSVNGLVAGLMGSGKSMCLKTLAVREMAYGRSVVIEGDPKGEWARLADAVGGQRVSAGQGRYLNPLDGGARPASVSDERWRRLLVDLRTRALKSVIMAISPTTGGSSDASWPAKQAVLDRLVIVSTDQEEQPTITTMVRRLSSAWWQVAGLPLGLTEQGAQDASRQLLLILNRLVDGPLSGSFEKESTVSVDATNPMIVFDTGSVADTDEVRKAVYTAAMSAAIDRICYSHDGRFRLVIAEEGWDLLRNPALVDGWDARMRLSGDLGVSNWMLVHELSDLDAYAEQGSQQRNLINGILTKSQTMILYRQSPSSVSVLRSLVPSLTDEEAANVSHLSQGVGLWRIGESIRQLVYPLMSQEAYRVFNTDSGRAG